MLFDCFYSVPMSLLILNYSLKSIIKFVFIWNSNKYYHNQNMKQVKDHIFSNVDFPKKAIEGVFTLKTKIRGLIMGPTGNGKTNLMNNICN